MANKEVSNYHDSGRVNKIGIPRSSKKEPEYKESYTIIPQTKSVSNIPTNAEDGLKNTERSNKIIQEIKRFSNN